MHFGENQLSPSLIGLSPLPTAHPPGFQPWWVRSSTRSYPRFNLAMGRSLGFGSRARDSIALFGLAFATATPHGLTSPRTTNSQAHSSKGTQSPRPERLRLSRLVGTRFQVLFHSPPGVLFTFPSRYLSAIGHQGVCRLSGWSRRIQTEFHGLGATWETRSRDNAFSCTGLSPSTATPSRGLPLTTLFSHSLPGRQPRPNGPTTPLPQRLPAITWKRFSLLRFRSPLLTESRLFSLPVGTEMFHFPTFPPHALCVQARVTPHDWCGVPPFGNPRINARLTAPRGLSQPPTSFIGSWCQGIHRVPLTTWPHKKPTTPPPEGSVAAGLHKPCYYRVRRCSRPLCSSQRTTSHHLPAPAGPGTPTGGTAVRGRDGPVREETVARSLRTQQRAYDPVLRAIRVPHATEVTPYWGPTEAGGRTGQCSTLEHHPTRCADHPSMGGRSWCGRGSAPLPTREAVKCSLERR